MDTPPQERSLDIFIHLIEQASHCSTFKTIKVFLSNEITTIKDLEKHVLKTVKELPIEYSMLKTCRNWYGPSHSLEWSTKGTVPLEPYNSLQTMKNQYPWDEFKKQELVPVEENVRIQIIIYNEGFGIKAKEIRGPKYHNGKEYR